MQKNNSQRWIAILFKLSSKGKIKIIATGASHGRVAKVTSREKGRDRIIKKLIATLATISFTSLILKIIQSIGIKGEQLIGINKGEADTINNELYLSGHCLEAYKDVPEENEEMKEVKSPDNIESKKPYVDKWLVYTNRNLPDILKDLYYSETKNISVIVKQRVIENFTQAGVWVITDDVPLDYIRDNLFGPKRFFSAEHLEVLLILHKHLTKAGIDTKTKKIREGILYSISRNSSEESLSVEVIKEWLYKYNLRVYEKKEGDEVTRTIGFEDYD